MQPFQGLLVLLALFLYKVAYSTTAQGSLQGTVIRLFQFPKQASDVSQLAVQRVNLCSTRCASRAICLHDIYFSVLPVSIKTSDVNLPSTSQGGVETLSRDQLSIAIDKQFKRCSSFMGCLSRICNRTAQPLVK